MRELFQAAVDAVAKWGPWLLMLVGAACLVGLGRLWRTSRSLAPGAIAWRLLKSSWCSWLIVSGVGLWLLKVQLAPLTTALTTLQTWRDGPMPAFSFRRVSDDHPHRISEFKGRVVVLNLWATYCAPCIQELPILERLQRAYRDKGVAVLALSDEPRERLQQFLAKHPCDLAIGYTPLEWLKLEDFRPVTLIIDRDGVLRKHFLGRTDFEGFEAHLRPYLP